MRTIFAAVILGAIASAELMDSREFEFMKYIAKWNKSYGTREEFKARLARFIETDIFISEVNAPDSEHTHTAGHNKFSDWTRAEYKRMLNPSIANKVRVPNNEPIILDDHNLGSSLNWANGNCVTPVKD